MDEDELKTHCETRRLIQKVLQFPQENEAVEDEDNE
jgi:hypothetical protein